MAHTKRTPEIEDKIVASVRNGAFPKHAAEAAGISKTTMWDWMQDDTAFAERIAGAKADALNESARIISGSDDWRARAWWAERMSPEFNLAAKLELTGANGGPIEVAEVPLDAERAEAVAAILKSTGAA